MPDNYKKISLAIAALATRPMDITSSPGVSVETAAKKAKVSRATFYRYLAKYTALQESFDSLNGHTSRESKYYKLKSANSGDALVVIENLKKEVIAAQKERDEISKAKNVQIILLWNECKRLRQRLGDSSVDFGGNILPLRN
ncbi:MAG: hypothetical protein QM742_03235 [Aquabacterium sp.]